MTSGSDGERVPSGREVRMTPRCEVQQMTSGCDVRNR